MINKLWLFFIISGIFYSFITGNIEEINLEILSSSETAFKMICQIFPVVTLWLGIMNIAKKSGLLEKLSQKSAPILSILFPEIPKGHESLGYISSNVIANIFGLGNAATPFGLKAMKSMQELNPNKEVATRSMITFLVLNTSGLTIIPTTILSLRVMYQSKNPTEIILAIILSTIVSTITGLIFDRILYKRSKHV